MATAEKPDMVALKRQMLGKKTLRPFSVKPSFHLAFFGRCALLLLG